MDIDDIDICGCSTENRKIDFEPLPIIRSNEDMQEMQREPLMPGKHDESKQQKPPRIHFIDWMRFVLVFGVVVAHSSVTGMRGGINGGVLGVRPPNVEVDSRAWTEKDPSPLTVRWLSVLRPASLPMLFWISGASFAISCRGQFLKRLARSFTWLTLYTLTGFASNAFVVHMGPQDTNCSPADHDRDTCKGYLWDFQVWPWEGLAGAIQFQMWYTVYLMILLLMNLPFLSVFCADWRNRQIFIPPLLMLEWLLTMVVYAVLVLLSSDSCQQPLKAFVMLAVYELVFLAVSPLAVADFRYEFFPTGIAAKINVRVVHYILGIITWLEFSTTPFAKRIESFSLSAIFYVFVGFNLYFRLGCVMLRARIGEREDDAPPICSKAWPFSIVALALTAPTSNWDLAGYLTYPFYPRISDRMLYVAHGLLNTFCVDRVGQLAGEQCAPAPAVINRAGLLLFLMHPLFLAIVISKGIDESFSVACCATAMSIVVAAVTLIPRALCANRS